MRLWTVHPQYLDPQGLVAAWREALLAQKVLAGLTKGYRLHPQLIRFKQQTDPLISIGSFLTGLAEEAQNRGYQFDTSKILRGGPGKRMAETKGQLLYEWGHLRAKLRLRAPSLACQVEKVTLPVAHPLFRIVPGRVNSWEKQ